MPNPIPLSYLNDFLFCPRSIYNYQLYQNFEEELYQDAPQKMGKNAHERIDNKKYSARKNILQSFEVYCEKYGLFGKIDTLDVEKGLLSERKNKITTLYDGYFFQLYGQYFALEEMGFKVKKMVIYDFSQNKTHPIALPSENLEMFHKFENLLEQIQNFSLLESDFVANVNKCQKCIYRFLCDKSAAEE